MSVTYLLWAYPESVLEDRSYVVLLSALERQGASTTAELADVAAMDPVDVGARMMILYRNQLVELADECFQVGHRGKTLLDRFQIGDDIIDDVIGATTQDRWRETLRGILANYRDDAYVNYLGSLRTQYTWKTILDNAGPVTAEQRAGTRLALLVRDFEDWATASRSPAAADATTRLRLLYKKRDASPDPSDPTVAALTLVKTLRPGSESGPLWERLESRVLRTHDVPMLVILDEAQRLHSHHEWVSATCGPQFLASLQADSIGALQVLLAARRGIPAPTLAWDATEPVSPEPIPKRDAVTALLTSHTIHELARALGVSDGEATSVAAMLRERCELILGSASAEEAGEKGPMGTGTPGELIVVLDAGRDYDDEELARLMQRLRRELLDLDIEGVELVTGGDVPQGAKDVELLSIGGLAVMLAMQRSVLRSVVEATVAWLRRQRIRRAKLTLGGDTLEVSTLSSEEQTRLVELWVARHAGDG
jgi:hypothetical protein